MLTVAGGQGPGGLANPRTSGLSKILTFVTGLKIDKWVRINV